MRYTLTGSGADRDAGIAVSRQAIVASRPGSASGTTARLNLGSSLASWSELCGSVMTSTQGHADRRQCIVGGDRTDTGRPTRRDGPGVAEVMCSAGLLVAWAARANWAAAAFRCSGARG
jgi:hypothetical protein